MGEVEHLMAEPEEGDVEDVDGLHPPTLAQQNPWVISQVLSSVVMLIASNGWYALAFVVISYLIWINIRPNVKRWKKKREDDNAAAAYHKDPDMFLAKERAIDAARLRMQEQYNQSALQWAEKQKELEEKKRQERIEDWERHKRGEGYRNKSKPDPAPAAAAGSSSEVKKDSGKPKLKPEYNPLTGNVGEGGSCGWRPARRGASGGG